MFLLFFGFFVNLLLLTTPIFMMQIFDRVLSSGRLETLVFLALIAALVATGISTFYYLGVYTPAKRFGDLNTRLAHRLGVWARELEPDRSEEHTSELQSR